MFLSRGDRYLGVAFQTHLRSQASSCLRKGTPLASRVAQGVSGPSSSCVWNPRVFDPPPPPPPLVEALEGIWKVWKTLADFFPPGDPLNTSPPTSTQVSLAGLRKDGLSWGRARVWLRSSLA